MATEPTESFPPQSDSSFLQNHRPHSQLHAGLSRIKTALPNSRGSGCTHVTDHRAKDVSKDSFLAQPDFFSPPGWWNTAVTVELGPRAARVMKSRHDHTSETQGTAEPRGSKNLALQGLYEGEMQ